MFPSHVQRMRNIICEHRDVFGIAEDPEPSPELVTAFSKDRRFKGRELRVIAPLRAGLYMARTFLISSTGITFLILDETRPGCILYQFEWSCSYNYSYATAGGFLEFEPHFNHQVSADGVFVIIVGPAEDSSRDYLPTAKLVDCRGFTLKVIMVVSTLLKL